MKYLLFTATALVILAGVSGCTPKLAQVQYGEKEQRWVDYLKEAYPEWEAPETIPPVVEESVSATEEKVIVEEPVSSSAPAFTMPDAGPPEQRTESYVVQKGDSLWKIAEKFYKNGSQWRRIQDANMDKLSNPRALRAGMILQVPVP